MAVLIGTAGWSLPRAVQEHFSGSGSHLERYAARFPVAEINSSFHRSHRATTWLRWRDSVPADFRFSVKIPKAVTHTSRLEDCDQLVTSFLEESSVLEGKLGCLLVQLPPSLTFDAKVAGKFFDQLRSRTAVPIACEPRHESWFNGKVDKIFERYQVARVAADPPRVPAGALPGGWRGLSYYRLHGSPKVYYSSYSNEFIASLAQQVAAHSAVERTVWVIFDNTTLGAATRNALDLAASIA